MGPVASGQSGLAVGTAGIAAFDSEAAVSSPAAVPVVLVVVAAAFVKVDPSSFVELEIAHSLVLESFEADSMVVVVAAAGKMAESSSLQTSVLH